MPETRSRKGKLSVISRKSRPGYRALDCHSRMEGSCMAVTDMAFRLLGELGNARVARTGRGEGATGA